MFMLISVFGAKHIILLDQKASQIIEFRGIKHLAPGISELFSKQYLRQKSPGGQSAKNEFTLFPSSAFVHKAIIWFVCVFCYSISVVHDNARCHFKPSGISFERCLFSSSARVLTDLLLVLYCKKRNSSDTFWLIWGLGPPRALTELLQTLPNLSQGPLYGLIICAFDPNKCCCGFSMFLHNFSWVW